MKKIMAILMLVAVGGLILSSVVASANTNVELIDHDFDGHFQMKIPKNASFKKTDSEGFLESTAAYHDDVNGINITYIIGSDVNDTLVKKTVDDLKKQGANVSTEGNLNLVQAGDINSVIFQKDSEFIMVASDKLDMNTVTVMAQSVKF